MKRVGERRGSGCVGCGGGGSLLDSVKRNWHDVLGTLTWRSLPFRVNVIILGQCQHDRHAVHSRLLGFYVISPSCSARANQSRTSRMALFSPLYV